MRPKIRAQKNHTTVWHNLNYDTLNIIECITK